MHCTHKMQANVQRATRTTYYVWILIPILRSSRFINNIIFVVVCLFFSLLSLLLYLYAVYIAFIPSSSSAARFFFGSRHRHTHNASRTFRSPSFRFNYIIMYGCMYIILLFVLVACDYTIHLLAVQRGDRTSFTLCVTARRRTDTHTDAVQTQSQRVARQFVIKTLWGSLKCMYTIRFRCVDVEMRDNENFNFQCKKKNRRCVCVWCVRLLHAYVGEVAGIVTQLKWI